MIAFSAMLWTIILSFCCLCVHSEEPRKPASQQPLVDSEFVLNQPPLYYVSTKANRRHKNVNNDASRVVNMTDKDGNRFRCELPGPNVARPEPVKKKRRRRTISLPDIRLTTRQIFGSCTTWGEGQYWQYEVCHGNTVTQFHKPTPKSARTQVSVLGYYDKGATDSANNGAHHYTGGSQCGDNKSSNRSVEVVFECTAELRGATVDKVLEAHKKALAAPKGSLKGHIASVEEPVMCGYRAVYVGPLACTGVPMPEAPATSPSAHPENAVLKMHGKCVYSTEGWWQYELCFGRHIRQFHVEGDSVVTEFYLGRAPAKPSITRQELQTVHREPTPQGAVYIATTYRNGTRCELTEDHRQSELRFVCLPGEVTELQKVEEAATCRYTVVIGTPALCTMDKFKVTKRLVRGIQCFKT